MLFIFFLLPFFLVNAEMNSRVKAAFKQLNRQHNPNINWSDELEQKALEYLDSDHKVMVIKGQKIYPKNNTLELGIKLYKAFGSDV
uniref:Aminopeptidase n=1 Tax=Haemonchus contortus TaxID=6289 RepID=A0A7I4YYR0_HAECO